ncbi:MAG TPA: hypothetical protein VJM33_10920 [Microthrixaceae bacterium]|nr:hypothetical protein [Microthrixaceae bacterium]
MTDLPVYITSLPAQLGATGRVTDGELFLEIEPHPALLHHGVIRASVLSYLVDCVAGIPLDRDPDAWAFTTDMTVRTRPIEVHGVVTAKFRLLREGRRSATGAVDLVCENGELLGVGAIGFARVPRREGDPPKIHLSVEEILEHFDASTVVTQPLRDAAGIEVVDAGTGVVEVPITAALLNPAGTLQGAMVALVAEAAAEELFARRAGGPVVVTDLDLRYLGQTGAGPVRTRTKVVGDGADVPVEVELVDLSTDVVTTIVHARATPV